MQGVAGERHVQRFALQDDLERLAACEARAGSPSATRGRPRPRPSAGLGGLEPAAGRSAVATRYCTAVTARPRPRAMVAYASAWANSRSLSSEKTPRVSPPVVRLAAAVDEEQQRVPVGGQLRLPGGERRVRRRLLLEGDQCGVFQGARLGPLAADLGADLAEPAQAGELRLLPGRHRLLLELLDDARAARPVRAGTARSPGRGRRCSVRGAGAAGAGGCISRAPLGLGPGQLHRRHRPAAGLPRLYRGRQLAGRPGRPSRPGPARRCTGSSGGRSGRAVRARWPA